MLELLKTNEITIGGTGYVGLCLAVLLAQKYHVVTLGIGKEKVDLLNAGNCRSRPNCAVNSPSDSLALSIRASAARLRTFLGAFLRTSSFSPKFSPPTPNSRPTTGFLTLNPGAALATGGSQAARRPALAVRSAWSAG